MLGLPRMLLGASFGLGLLRLLLIVVVVALVNL
jgi:hypothetical protein